MRRFLRKCNAIVALTWREFDRIVACYTIPFSNIEIKPHKLHVNFEKLKKLTNLIVVVLFLKIVTFSPHKNIVKLK